MIALTVKCSKAILKKIIQVEHLALPKAQKTGI